MLARIGIIGSFSWKDLNNVRMAFLILEGIAVLGSQNDHAYSVYKPQILSEDEIKHLLENTSDGFLLVLSCDKLQILYVSDAVSKATLHSPVSLLLLFLNQI